MINILGAIMRALISISFLPTQKVKFGPSSSVFQKKNHSKEKEAAVIKAGQPGRPLDTTSLGNYLVTILFSIYRTVFAIMIRRGLAKNIVHPINLAPKALSSTLAVSLLAELNP
jgi:hypothetical protein